MAWLRAPQDRSPTRRCCCTLLLLPYPVAAVVQARLALRVGQQVLRSWPFSLEHGSQHQLLLQHSADGRTAGYFVTVSVELRQQAGAVDCRFLASPVLGWCNHVHHSVNVSSPCLFVFALHHMCVVLHNANSWEALGR